jgi:YD repeat-containing protein
MKTSQSPRLNYRSCFVLLFLCVAGVALPRWIVEASAGTATSRYTYDAAGRVSTKITPEGTIRFTYDKAGNLIEVADLIGTWLYTYDDCGRVTSVVNPDRKDIRYLYNRAGKLSQLTVAGQNIGYRYDKKGRLIQVFDPQLGTFALAYDDADRITRVIPPAGLATSNACDDVHQLLERMTPNGGAACVYDYLGRLYSRSEPGADTSDRYLYSDSQVMAEYDSAGVIRRRYLWGAGVDLVLGFHDAPSGHAYDLHRDSLNGGVPTVHTADAASIADRLLFGGLEWEPGFGLYTRIESKSNEIDKE